MSNHDDHVRLRHMLDAAQKIASFTNGKSREEFDADEILQLDTMLDAQDSSDEDTDSR